MITLKRGNILSLTAYVFNNNFLCVVFNKNSNSSPFHYLNTVKVKMAKLITLNESLHSKYLKFHI